MPVKEAKLHAAVIDDCRVQSRVGEEGTLAFYSDGFLTMSTSPDGSPLGSSWLKSTLLFPVIVGGYKYTSADASSARLRVRENR